MRFSIFVCNLVQESSLFGHRGQFVFVDVDLSKHSVNLHSDIQKTSLPLHESYLEIYLANRYYCYFLLIHQIVNKDLNHNLGQNLYE